MPTSFHHIAVEVSDPKKSEEFYCNLLGFKKTGEYHFADRQRTIVFVELDGVCLELLAGPEPETYVAPPGKQVGYKHLCMRTDNVDADIARLRAAGVNITLEPFDTEMGSRISFFEDPDGLPLELWQDKAV